MKPITIIGGGLSGFTLGILLRRENVPVAVIEAGKYPRHRVCGEFLSGHGRKIFATLGVEPKKRIAASVCSFHLKNKRPVQLRLPSPALCISRYELDALLAEEFERVGGILKSNERANAEVAREGVVRATGRRRAENSGAHLIGLKAHAHDASLSSDLEMHFGPRHYVGLCRVGDDRVNVCGLFFSQGAIHSLRDQWKSTLTSSVFSNALNNTAWDETSFSSVAGLTLDRHAPKSQFAVGDAAAMIPPLTGNGMSMAFESAELASQALLNFSAGKIPWPDCLRQHQTLWRSAFSSRLRWASFVQALLFNSVGQQLLYISTRFTPRLPMLFFARTR